MKKLFFDVFFDVFSECKTQPPKPGNAPNTNIAEHAKTEPNLQNGKFKVNQMTEINAHADAAVVDTPTKTILLNASSSNSAGKKVKIVTPSTPEDPGPLPNIHKGKATRKYKISYSESESLLDAVMSPRENANENSTENHANNHSDSHRESMFCFFFVEFLYLNIF